MTWLQQNVLRAFAFHQQRQSLARNKRLEMVACLMSGKGGFIGEQFVKKELRGIFFPSADEEELNARFSLSPRQKALKDFSDPLGFMFFGFPLCDNQKAAIACQFADVTILHNRYPCYVIEANIMAFMSLISMTITSSDTEVLQLNASCQPATCVVLHEYC
jgi:hypothetical protein